MEKHISVRHLNLQKIDGGSNGINYIRNKGKNGKFKHSKFAPAILKYGWDNFEHIFLNETSDPINADKLESYYISIYDSVNSGYNCNTGGNANKKLSDETKKKISESGKQRYKNMSTEEYNNLVKYLREHNPMLGKKWTDKQREAYNNKNKDFLFGKNNPSARPVDAIDPATGNVYKSFETMTDAVKFFNLSNTAHISECCRGKRKKCKGYIWKYRN